MEWCGPVTSVAMQVCCGEKQLLWFTFVKVIARWPENSYVLVQETDAKNNKINK